MKKEDAIAAHSYNLGERGTILAFGLLVYGEDGVNVALPDPSLGTLVYNNAVTENYTPEMEPKYSKVERCGDMESFRTLDISRDEVEIFENAGCISADTEADITGYSFSPYFKFISVQFHRCDP